jgi:radical SAM superfamily enzyme YgiQ (UPF0313 family)
VKTLILFVRNQEFAFNTSVAALAGVARQHGFDCAAHGIEDGQRVDDVLEQVLAYEPDLVCATFMTRDLPGFRALLPRLKQHSQAFTAVGGYHTTARPRDVAQWPGVDAIGIGEGERPFLSLLRALAAGQRMSTIPGLWVRSDGGFLDPVPPADVEPNIADLPPWDYSIFADPLIPGDAGTRYLVSRTSRSCPFACTYCTVPAWEATNGLRQRQVINARPVAQLCDELAGLRDRCHPSDIEFWDPQFRFANDWLEEFAERFPVEVGLPFRVLMHAKTLNQHRIGLLAKAGCTQVYCGIESGDFDFRKNVLNKACSDDDIVRTTEWVRAAGIKASAFVMWNMPGETREQAEKTIEMAERIRFDHLRVNSYIPLPGTAMGDAMHLEFPDTPVEVFEPLPEWRHDRDANWSAMSAEDHRIMFRAFQRLHDRYSEQTDAPVPGRPRGEGSWRSASST